MKENMAKIIFLFLSTLIINIANAGQWIEQGNVCAEGPGESDARRNLTAMLGNQKIYIHDGYTLIYGNRNLETDKYIVKPTYNSYKTGTVSISKFLKHLPLLLTPPIYWTKACTTVTGAKAPAFVKSHYKCVRENNPRYYGIIQSSSNEEDPKNDSMPSDAFINLEDNNNYYRSNANGKLTCKRKPDNSRVVTLNCPQFFASEPKTESGQIFRVTLNQDTGNMNAVVCMADPKNKDMQLCEFHSQAKCKEVKITDVVEAGPGKSSSGRNSNTTN